MKVLTGGAWKDGIPKGVLQAGAWKVPSKVSTLKNGVWSQVWPDSLSARAAYIASVVFSGSTNTTLPTHSAGDLLVVLANGITAPTAPAGWKVVQSSSDSGAPNFTLTYRIATASGTGTGSWMNHAYGVGFVFRNFNTTTPIGAVATTPGAAATTTYTAPALTLTDPSGASAVMHEYYNGGSSGGWVNQTPSGFLLKNLQARVAVTQMLNTAVATGKTSMMTHSVAAVWRTVAFEVLAA